MRLRTASTRAIAASLAVFALSFAPPGKAENLTPEMRKLLETAKLDVSVMDGLDKELAVPAAMIAAAKKEGKLSVGLQMSDIEFTAVAKIFGARYPGIEFEYVRAIGGQPQKVLIAYKAGTVINDVLAAYDNRADEFRAIGLVELRDLPAYPSLRPEIKAMKDGDAADKLNYWCGTYSPERVNAADLPRTWDDLLDNPRWRNGHVAVASNAGQTWLPTMWVKLGEGWAQNYLKRLFGEVRPQLRKETLAATSKLVSLGEFDFVFAVQDYVTERDAKRGMPVAPHCPEPIPATWGKLGILAKSQHPNAAKLFVNWYMSKEGQVASYVLARQVPTHAGLAGREFLPYPDQILGKKLIYRTDDVLAQQQKVTAAWRQYWENAGGAKIDN